MYCYIESTQYVRTLMSDTKHLRQLGNVPADDHAPSPQRTLVVNRRLQHFLLDSAKNPEQDLPAQLHSSVSDPPGPALHDRQISLAWSWYVEYNSKKYRRRQSKKMRRFYSASMAIPSVAAQIRSDIFDVPISHTATPESYSNKLAEKNWPALASGEY